MLLYTVINQNVTVDNTLIRTNWFLNLLTWSIGTFLFECYIKTLTDTLTTKLTIAFSLCFMLLTFFIFALLIVSGAYDIRLINKYVDICTFCVCQFFYKELLACLEIVEGFRYLGRLVGHHSISRMITTSAEHRTHNEQPRRSRWTSIRPRWTQSTTAVRRTTDSRHRWSADWLQETSVRPAAIRTLPANSRQPQLLYTLLVHCTRSPSPRNDLLQKRTGPSGGLALVRWPGKSGIQVGRHVTCWSRSNDLPCQQRHAEV